MEQVVEVKEQNKFVAMLSIDMSAAFDLCAHDVLLEKCWLLSLSLHSRKFIEDFLSERSTYVEVGGGKSSSLASGGVGVIQGSRSSGELFTHYLNTLPAQVNGGRVQTNILDSTANEFVDDLMALIRASSVEELKLKISQEFNAIEKF